LKNIEWNGRGNAQVVMDGESVSNSISSGDSKKKKRVHAETIITEDKEEEEEASLVSPSISSD